MFLEISCGNSGFIFMSKKMLGSVCIRRDTSGFHRGAVRQIEQGGLTRIISAFLGRLSSPHCEWCLRQFAMMGGAIVEWGAGWREGDRQYFGDVCRGVLASSRRFA